MGRTHTDDTGIRHCLLNHYWENIPSHPFASLLFSRLLSFSPQGPAWELLRGSERNQKNRMPPKMKMRAMASSRSSWPSSSRSLSLLGGTFILSLLAVVVVALSVVVVDARPLPPYDASPGSRGGLLSVQAHLAPFTSSSSSVRFPIS